jgi:hypothetical protein
MTGTHDFLGINFYTGHVGKSGEEGPQPSRTRDSGVILRQDPSWPESASSWLRVRAYSCLRAVLSDWGVQCDPTALNLPVLANRLNILFTRLKDKDRDSSSLSGKRCDNAKELRSPVTHRGGSASIPGQVVWDLWWTTWHWGGCSSSISISLAKSHSTECSILVCHPGLVIICSYCPLRRSQGLPRSLSLYFCQLSSLYVIPSLCTSSTSDLSHDFLWFSSLPRARGFQSSTIHATASWSYNIPVSGGRTKCTPSQLTSLSPWTRVLLPTVPHYWRTSPLCFIAVQ